MPERICRYIEVDGSKIDREARTIPLTFSSEFPALQRADENVPSAIKRAAGLAEGEVFVEILDHSPDSVDLSLLNNRGAFLDEHDEKDQIGVVERAEITEKQGRAIVKMDTHDKGKTRFEQMQSRSRPHISAGYKYTGFIRSEQLPNGRKAYRFAWKGLELSSVAIPADPTIGVARSYQDLPEVDSSQTANAKNAENNLTAEEIKRMRILLDAGATAQSGATVDEGKIRATAVEDFRKTDGERRKKIRAAGDLLIKDRPDMRDRLVSLVNESCEGEVDEQAFSIRAMREMITTKPANQITMRSLGCNQKEIDRYSLVRAIQSCVIQKSRGAVPDGLEGELHQEMSKRDLGFTPMGFLVPADANISPRTLGRADVTRMTRDMQVNIFGQGGATVATELMTPIIEILRNRMVMMSLGVRSLAGLEGNVVIPRQTGAGTAYAVSEIAQLSLSNQILDQIAVSPKRVGTTGNYSKQLVLQSSIDVESFMRDDFLKVLAIMWDRIILNGAGAGDEALGILNTPGIGSVTFGAAATFAKLVSFWTSVATANADVGEMGYVTSIAASGVLQAAAKLLVGATTVAANPLWEGNGSNGRVNGYRAEATNQMPSNLLLFGVFSEAIHALWGGYDVVVDPFTLADKGEVKITMNTYGDVAIRHPQCFCASADSAAQ